MEKKNKPKRPRRKSEDSSSSSYSTSSLSSDEDTSIQDLKPIKDYLADRRELARQIFKSVKGEKLRMMLPQALKKMEMSELEEWCSSELSGMSKTRILSILNGQPMLQSSDSNDTDDSGPSLEIISDTEEWLSDDDMLSKEVQEAPKVSRKSKSKRDKIKSKSQLDRGKDKDRAKSKLKARHKPEAVVKIEGVKVKKEGEKQEPKEKEGESLLDLFELEMRARAIRALIRKEEDIIPTAPPAQSSTSQANLPQAVPPTTKNSSVSAQRRNLSLKAVEDKLGEMDQNFREAERNKNKSRDGHSADDEEDVVLVVQPTTTIELLSSASEDEGQGKRVNQRLQNERVAEDVSVRNCAEETNKLMNTRSDDPTDGLNTNTVLRKDGAGDKVTEKANKEANKNLEKVKNDVGKVTDNTVGDAIGASSNNGTIKSSDRDMNDDNGTTNSDVESKQMDKILFKKLRRRPNIRAMDKSSNNSEKNIPVETTGIGTNESMENTNTKRIETDKKALESIKNVEASKSELSHKGKDREVDRLTSTEIAGSSAMESLPESGKAIPSNKVMEKPKNQGKPQRKMTQADEDKLGDLEIVIDLDDYPDDMEDIENNDEDTKSASNVKNEEQGRSVVEGQSKGGREESETWATRYYQTDDVQNVIKESKIQSEIRKRLRERQRLARLNNSPNSNASPAPVPSEAKADKIEVKTTGSVDEYLALKSDTSLADSTSISVDTIMQKSSVSDVHINETELEKPVDSLTAASFNALIDLNTLTSTVVMEGKDSGVEK